MNGSVGCFTYLFLVSFGLFGYTQLGRHSTDFSADGNQVVYAHNLKEVRILDTATRKPGPVIYAAPEGYIVDSVHWSQATGEIYAVIQNAESCDDESLMPDIFNQTEFDESQKWNVRLLRLDPGGDKHEAIIDRSYYCPTRLDNEAPIDFLTDSSEHQMLNAAYQNFEENIMNFEPVGWESGALYFVEPEEIGKPSSSVTRLDLLTGKNEKAFALPRGDNFLLSEDGRYLISMYGSYDEEEQDDEPMYIALYEVSTGKKIFSDLLCVITDTEVTAKNKNNILDMQYVLSLLSDLDAVAAVDSQAGKLFYIKMNMKTKKVSLESYSIQSGSKKTLFTSHAIYSPIIIPQRNAILVTTYESPDISKLNYPENHMYFPYNGQTTLSLISYQGKVIRKRLMPPFLAPLRLQVKPEASVSPDGQFIVAGIEYPENNRSGESTEPFAVVPIIIDIDRGTYDFVITEPRDNAVAGKILFDMGMNRAAFDYLESYARKPGPETPDIDALYSLFFIYKDEGNPKHGEIYEMIRAALSGAENTGSLRFVLGFMSFRDIETREGLHDFWGHPITMPEFKGMSRSDFKFVQKVISLPENRNSAIAEYLLGSVLVRLNQPAEAVPHFERAFELVSFVDYCKQEQRDFKEEYRDPRCNEKYRHEFHMDVYRLSGELYESAGMKEKALEYYSLFINGVTESEFQYCCGSDIYAVRGKRVNLYEKLKRYDEALMDYQILLENSETNLANLIQAKQILNEKKPKKCDLESDEVCEDTIWITKDGDSVEVGFDSIDSLIKSEKAKIELYRKKIAKLKKRLKR